MKKLMAALMLLFFTGAMVQAVPVFAKVPKPVKVHKSHKHHRKNTMNKSDKEDKGGNASGGAVSTK